MIHRLAILLLGCAAAALADPRNLPRAGGSVAAIVQYRGAPSAADGANLAGPGGRARQTLPRGRAVVAEIPPAHLETLAPSANGRSTRPAPGHTAAPSGTGLVSSAAWGSSLHPFTEK